MIEGKDFSFPVEEEKILKFWDDIDAFKEQLKRTEGQPEYIFYDGPPFATGKPHYGHILAGTIKDIVTRYASMTGYHVMRRFGWDTHGLPVEYEIDKKLNITNRGDVLAMGIDKYNEECRSIVMRYAGEWEETVHRLGRWIDFKDDYKTLYPWFMESVWWVFSELHKKGLVYQGYKVMPYSAACSTPLSNFEAGLNYKDVPDPAIMVTFPLVDDADGASMVAWTTTPWTLPSNLCLCVNPGFDYVYARDPKTQKVYVVAECRLEAVPGAVPKKGKGKKEPEPGWEVLRKVKGADLKGKHYEPLFQYYADRKGQAFRVVADGYVTSDSGTGVVHCAPAFGEDDYRVCIENDIVAKGEKMPCPVDDDGRFCSPCDDLAGQFVKDADKGLIATLKASGRLLDNQVMVHSYPYCWRSDTPLIYKAVPSWFVAVETIKDKLLANNAQTYWVPSYVKEKRFHNWLEGAHDWAVSRSRFWGTPLPIWMSEDKEEIVVVGSIAELEELTGEKVTDLHRHFIDHLEIPSKKGKGVLRRVEDVFDCWFESGSMPYAQLHYPFENKELFERNFPADFIAEGLDQTRGWFYTLMVLSTALFDKPAFKNLVCNGLVLAADGKKMSKRLQNYPDPKGVIGKYGADALRLYLINSPVVRAEPLRFKEEGVFGVVKDVFLPWYNAYRFFAQSVQRLQSDAGIAFDPAQVDLGRASNVLDRWIAAASRTLGNCVRDEMAAYRLYTVVPVLVTFVENLTNIYVRFNRSRLKGEKSPEDCQMALASLYSALMTTCRVMAPFTPFFTEHMYQNLRKLSADLPESVHFYQIPEKAAPHPEDHRIEASVQRMMTVIEQCRVIRDRHNKPVKTPLAQMTVVHTDEEFLADLEGDLSEYVAQECNVLSLETCADPLKFCTVRAQPDFQALGKRLGKDMGKVGGAIKNWGPADIAALERDGQVDVAGHTLTMQDVQIKRDFTQPAGTKPDELDAVGDGEVLVVMDLRINDTLVRDGMAREVVNRFQKLRKQAGLVPGDEVDCFFTVRGGSAAAMEAVLSEHGARIAAKLGRVPSGSKPAWAVAIASEDTTIGADALAVELEVTLARPCVKVDAAACARDFGEAAEGVALWLASKDAGALRAAGGKVSGNVDGKAVTAAQGTHYSF